MLRAVTYSRVAAKHRLAAWVRLLALTAAYPELAFEAATVGRAAGNALVTIARIPPLGADLAACRETALEHLATLVDLYDRGMREPLPLYCLTSAAYAEAACAGNDPVTAGRKQWASEWNYDHEDKELEHQFVLGGVKSFDALLAEPPKTDEHGPGWDADETTRLGRYARRLWAGLIASEQVSAQ